MKRRLALFLLLIPAGLPAQEKAPAPIPNTGNVSLPLEEYDRLLELAGKSGKKPELPPVPYALKCADLELRVGSELVTGTVVVEGEVFAQGATKVDLTTGITILNATQAGRNLPLQRQGTTYSAILRGASDFAVTLEVGLPLSIEAGRASFSLPVPAAASIRLSLTIPGDHTSVRISPGLVIGRKSDAGRTVIDAALEPGRASTIWWVTREMAVSAAPRETRFLSDVKTLASIGDAELNLAVLADLSVVQGEPAQFDVEIPSGYEVAGVTGASVESSREESGHLIMNVTAAQRSHQILISLQRGLDALTAEVPLLSFKGSQRETGEVLIEGPGTLELSAAERGGLKRMDLKETNVYLASLAQESLHAAFRYHRQTSSPPGLALKWNRFPDGNVVAAVVERAVITTLVTVEGKSLTEVSLVLKNHAQPFLKLALPPGTSVLSAEVAGEQVKPAEGADGSRIPLLRPGFQPADSYRASFVFMHSGTPFAKKGDASLVLPKMDIPIAVLQWEVFLPEQYRVKDFGGDVVSAELLPPAAEQPAVEAPGRGYVPLRPAQLGGFVVDQSDACIPGARVTVTHVDSGASWVAIANEAGYWVVSNLPTGRTRITAEMPGFKNYAREISYDAARPESHNFAMSVGSISEAITVAADTDSKEQSRRIEREARKNLAQLQNAPSTNVINLQRRVAGVLPIRIDVPRAGNSFLFVRPLVLDEETSVSFSYRIR
jgi:hypothetical protein